MKKVVLILSLILTVATLGQREDAAIPQRRRGRGWVAGREDGGWKNCAVIIHLFSKEPSGT